MGVIEKDNSKVDKRISSETLLQAYRLMSTAVALTEKYEVNAKVTSKYVHATSRGHEAMQIALGLLLKPQDYLSLYYRDDSVLLSIGLKPYDLMLQLMAKRDDPFSGGRTYYCHPSLRRDDMPKIPHQSSATGMQVIPTTGAALGLRYLEVTDQSTWSESDAPVVVCSIGDAAITEGEVSEALHMAALKQLPIIYFVQDNGWDISAKAEEIRSGDATTFAQGFEGIEVVKIEGNDFFDSYSQLEKVIDAVRKERRPFLVHGVVPLLGHHTSGVRKEWYRDDLEDHESRDPYPKLTKKLLELGITKETLNNIQSEVKEEVDLDYEKALIAEEPRPEDLFDFDYAPTEVTEEFGEREPVGNEKALMVDCALYAIREIMEDHPEALLYGQDVGGRLGGVFREAATLAQQFGDERVFNTPIQEAFIIGSTVGMSAVGLKPIVEVQFADYIWPGLNQLFTEVSRSYFLSNGKWPVSSVIRVPIGAYGSGGPFHSSSVESVLTSIRGIKIAYPSCGADLKGLMKAAYLDPNPVVMLEHKGLYWSKIKGTDDASSIIPSRDYVVPFGKARTVLESDDDNSIAIITYGMGVYWAKSAAKNYKDQIELLDLRTLVPIDEEAIFKAVRKCSKCIVLTEEPKDFSFAQSIAGRINEYCFESLDAPVVVVGAENLPAIPLNTILEQTMLPSAAKLQVKIEELLNY